MGEESKHSNCHIIWVSPDLEKTEAGSGAQRSRGRLREERRWPGTGHYWKELCHL